MLARNESVKIIPAHAWLSCQDTEALTKQLAKDPDNSLKAQVMADMKRLKSSNDLDLVKVGWLACFEHVYHVHH